MHKTKSRSSTSYTWDPIVHQCMSLVDVGKKDSCMVRETSGQVYTWPLFVTQLKLLILFTAYHTDTAYCRVTYFRGYKILRISQICRTLKIFILKIITLSFLLLTACSSSKIYSQNILFQANFQQSSKFYILENKSPYSMLYSMQVQCLTTV